MRPPTCQTAKRNSAGAKKIGAARRWQPLQPGPWPSIVERVGRQACGGAQTAADTLAVGAYPLIGCACSGEKDFIACLAHANSAWRQRSDNSRQGPFDPPSTSVPG